MPDAAPVTDSPLDRAWPPIGVDTGVAHTARVYDYLLGGKNNFPADREAAERILRGNPEMRDTCREQREYLRRAVRFLALAGIRQFIDIGTGLPTNENTHDVAQSVAADARVAYVDNDPIVLAHARVLLADRAFGRTVFLHADARDPERILADEELRELVDFRRPVAVLMIGILHFLTDADDPGTIIRTLMAAVPSGSHLAISHGTPDADADQCGATEKAYSSSAIPTRARTRAEVLDVMGPGLELVEPGLVLVGDWRPDGTSVVPRQRITYGAVARKV
jgi:hypothetical protein